MYLHDALKLVGQATLGESTVDVNEVVVSHERYVKQHGTAAVGDAVATWMFTSKGSGKPNFKSKVEVHKVVSTFKDATKSAGEWAKAHGHKTAYVMEDSTGFSRTNHHVDHLQTRAVDESLIFNRGRDTQVENKMNTDEMITRLNELSRKTLTNYVRKSVASEKDHEAWSAEHMKLAATLPYKHGGERALKTAVASRRDAAKRRAGVDTALNKLAKEDVQLDELSRKTLASYAKKSPSSEDDLQRRASRLSSTGMSLNRTTKKGYAQGQEMFGAAGHLLAKAHGRRVGHDRAIDRLAKEDVQIDELSRKTLGSYAKKAVTSADDLDRRATRLANNGHSLDRTTKKGYAQGQELFSASGHLQAKAHGRRVGHDRAIDRLAKEDVQLDELSRKTLGSYAKQASSDATFRSELAGRATVHASSTGAHGAHHADTAQRHLKKAGDRSTGITRAVNRLTKEDTYEESNDRAKHYAGATSPDTLDAVQSTGAKKWAQMHKGGEWEKETDRTLKSLRAIANSGTRSPQNPGNQTTGDFAVIK